MNRQWSFNASDSVKERLKLLFTAYSSEPAVAPLLIVEKPAGGITELIDWKHFMASTEGYLYHAPMAHSFWFGWGGDYATVCNQISSDSPDPYSDAIVLMGGNSKFSYEDLLADADAIGFSEYLINHFDDPYNVHFLSTALSYYSV